MSILWVFIKTIGGTILDMILTGIIVAAFIICIPMYLIFGIGRTKFREYMSNCGFFNFMAFIGKGIDKINNEIRF